MPIERPDLLAVELAELRHAEASHQASQNDAVMHASIVALLEPLVSIEAQTTGLNGELNELEARVEAAWRRMSILSVGPVTALATQSRT
jgi:hypothetical protein